MSDFLLIRDGRVVGEIPNNRVTVELNEDGSPRYIVNDCVTAHGPWTTCILCDDGSSKDLHVATKPEWVEPQEPR